MPRGRTVPFGIVLSASETPHGASLQWDGTFQLPSERAASSGAFAMVKPAKHLIRRERESGILEIPIIFRRGATKDLGSDLLLVFLRESLEGVEDLLGRSG